MAQDAPASNDALESLVRPDANNGDRTTDLSYQGFAFDLPPVAVDALPDAPDAAAIDAPQIPGVQDASPDGWSQTEGAAPDSVSLLADAAPDNGVIDAPSKSEPPETPPGADAEPDGTGDTAPGLPLWEDFRARCPREPWAGGRYIVDGDLVMDEAGLQSYYDAWFAAAEAAPTDLLPMGATSTWPSSDAMSLSYCISTDFGGNLATVEAAMQVATASWSDRVGVGYTYLPDEDGICDANNPNVTFDVRPVSGAGYAAVAFFPDGVRSNRSVLIDGSAFGSGADLEAILRHQLGHTLGFQHEFLWLDPGCTSEDTRLAVRIANYDIDTVMHLTSCRPSEIGGATQTEDDFFGAMTVYGLSPALIIVITM